MLLVTTLRSHKPLSVHKSIEYPPFIPQRFNSSARVAHKRSPANPSHLHIARYSVPAPLPCFYVAARKPAKSTYYLPRAHSSQYSYRLSFLGTGAKVGVVELMPSFVDQRGNLGYQF